MTDPVLPAAASASAGSERTKKRWVAPMLARLDSRGAENEINPVFEDGPISLGS